MAKFTVLAISLLLLNNLPRFHGYRDCRDLDFDETTESSIYLSVSDFIDTSDGKSCRISINEKLPVLEKGMLDAKPKAFYIRRLELQNNGIEVVESDPFHSSGECLVVVDLANNLIRSLMSGAFAQLKYLQKIDLSNNKLTFLNASAFASGNKLDVLNLANNQIVHIENTTNFANVTVLNLANNQLLIRPEIFTNFTNLIELRLDGNNISYLPLGLFTGLAKLENLFLGNNHLTGFATGTFSRISNLKVLNMSFNAIPVEELLNEKVFFPISKIHTLILDGNSDMVHLNASRVNQIFRRLLYLGVNSLPWHCETLMQFIKECNSNFIDVSKHLTPTFKEHNIHGIRCNDTHHHELIKQPVANNQSQIKAAEEEKSEAEHRLTQFKVVTVILLVVIVVLFCFILLRDRISMYRRKLNDSYTTNYKNDTRRMNSAAEEPECNLHLINEV